MVKQNEDGQKPDVYAKYDEQLDRTLPVYTITCHDNMFSPNDVIYIQALHFRDDRSAMKFSKRFAKSKKWHSWEVCDAMGVPVYRRNLNTREVFFRGWKNGRRTKKR